MHCKRKYFHITNIEQIETMGACGQVDRALDSRLEGLVFDSHCWSRVEVSGKLILYCLCPPSSDWYLAE